MINFRISNWLLVLVVALFVEGLFLPRALQSQDLQRAPSVTQILDRFESLTREGGNRGQNLVVRFLERESQALQIDSLVNGMARFAVQGSTIGVRREAIASLFHWAHSEVERNPGRVIDVLEGVYNDVPEASLKASLTHRMPELGPAGGVIGFLRRVAVVEETPWEGIPALAVEGLARLGEPGRAVLRELHAQELVTVLRARWRLEDLARRDFRIGGEGGS